LGALGGDAGGGDRDDVGLSRLDTGDCGANVDELAGGHGNVRIEATMESIHLKRLQGRLGDVVYQMTRVQFSGLSAPSRWQPALNAYRCSECMVICLDLAGVDRNGIELRVEPRRLVIRGQRQPPEPEGAENKPLQVLVMEIDFGAFEREVLLPSDVDRERVNAEQKNGLLWIYLPLQAHG
jgi:HSP20 family protein